jgi:hypothetical protein
MKLQSEAIEKYDEQLFLMTTVVQEKVQGIFQTEMKSYSFSLT